MDGWILEASQETLSPPWRNLDMFGPSAYSLAYPMAVASLQSWCMSVGVTETSVAIHRVDSVESSGQFKSFRTPSALCEKYIFTCILVASLAQPSSAGLNADQLLSLRLLHETTLVVPYYIAILSSKVGWIALTQHAKHGLGRRLPLSLLIITSDPRHRIGYR